MAPVGWLKRVTSWGLLLLIVFLFPIRDGFAQSTNYPCWTMGPWMMMGGPWRWVGGIFTMLFWVLVLVAIVLFIRRLATAGGNRSQMTYGSQLRNGPMESAMDILKKRYAGGEISKEQFESMRQDLE